MSDLSSSWPPGDEPAGDATSGEQSELDLGVVATGNSSVDAALSRLEGLSNRPAVDHPEIYERVHEDLTQAMSEFAADSDPPTATGGVDQ